MLGPNRPSHVSATKPAPRPKRPKPKRTGNITTPSNATFGSTSTSIEYLKCLIEPETYTSKIPNPVPVTTHISQAKGCVSLTANADGFFIGWINPHSANLITYCTSAVITDATAYAGLAYTSTSPSPLTGLDFRRRVVACVVTAEVLSPNMTRKGLITGAFLSYQPSTVTGLTTDSIRDMPDSLTLNAAKQPLIRVLYKPYDPACSEFTL